MAGLFGSFRKHRCEVIFKDAIPDPGCIISTVSDTSHQWDRASNLRKRKEGVLGHWMSRKIRGSSLNIVQLGKRNDGNGDRNYNNANLIVLQAAGWQLDKGWL